MKPILAISLCIQLVLASDPWDGIGGGESFGGGISLGGGHGGGSSFSLGSLFGLGGGHGGSFVLPIPEIGLTLSKIPILLPIPTIILRARKELITKPQSIPISSHGHGGWSGFGGGVSIGSIGGHGGGGWWRRR